MNKKINVALALAAGLAGGILTRFITPQPAFAQDQARVAKEIRAQSFTLVDSSDRAVGTFAVGPLPGSDATCSASRESCIYGIVLTDPSGRVIWSAGGSPVRRLSQR
jgi:hypothetical protein